MGDEVFMLEDPGHDPDATPMSGEAAMQYRSGRCPHCGRYLQSDGHCSLEVPVERGWLWEHL